MRKFFIALISACAFLFIAAIVVGFFLPNDFTIRRSVTVEASPERLYELVGDLENWAEWGPWKDADESLQVDIGEQSSGVGASQRWMGKDGGGRLVFTEVDPDAGVVFDLFFNEDKFQNVSSIRYTCQQETCEVVWEMSGRVPVPALGGYLAMTMDSMIGPMFEQGLLKLKAAAETRSAERVQR